METSKISSSFWVPEVEGIEWIWGSRFGCSRFGSSGSDGSGFEGSGFEGSGFEGSGFEGSSFEGSGFEGSGFYGLGFGRSGSGGSNADPEVEGTTFGGVVSFIRHGAQTKSPLLTRLEIEAIASVTCRKDLVCCTL